MLHYDFRGYIVARRYFQLLEASSSFTGSRSYFFIIGVCDSHATIRFSAELRRRAARFLHAEMLFTELSVSFA